MVEIRAPSEQTEGTRSQLLRWLRAIGEPVAQNEPLIEIETDKVTVEVASPASGVLSEILKHEQEEILPGELLGRIEPHSAAGAVAEASSGRSPEPLPPATTPGTATGTSAAGRGERRVASELSPAVRRLLKERGLDAAAVRGTGPAGRITVEDVLRAAPGAAGTQEGSTPSHRVPHTAVRRRIAEHMVQSLLHTAPHVTTVFEADLGKVLAHRAQQREAFEKRGVALTLTAYFVRAVVSAIRAVPEANSRWTDTELEIYDAIHVGVATAVESVGLVVPVLRDAEKRDLLETARGLEDLVVRARAGKLSPADVRGGTFTISNHGVSGSLLAAPIIINQPQSAILGVGKLERRPVVVQADGAETIAVRPRCYVTLTLDHRVMDGHRANRFMQTLVAHLADWPAS